MRDYVPLLLQTSLARKWVTALKGPYKISETSRSVSHLWGGAPGKTTQNDPFIPSGAKKAKKRAKLSYIWLSPD